MSSNEERMGRALSVSRRVMRGFNPGELASARRKLRISRAELARRAGIGGTTIGRWESDHASPQVDLLARVVEALGIEISDVVQVPADDRFPGDWRVLKGLTQPQLGAAAGTSTQMVGSVERGEIALSDTMARKLSAALGISDAELRASYERARTRPPGTPA